MELLRVANEEDCKRDVLLPFGIVIAAFGADGDDDREIPLEEAMVAV